MCVAISAAFNLALFDDLGQAATQRSLLSATVLPVMVGAPLFFVVNLRLRGLAMTNMRLRVVARTDSLTACLNRGAFTTRVDEWLSNAQEARRGALLMIDADNFKAINDRYGHHMGDEALTIIARSIRAVLREGDIVGRMGGEEFAVFLPDVSQEQAAAIAERIRRSVNLAVFAPDGRQRALSVSIGGAVFSQPTSFSELFRIADQRLYGAKHAGRNIATIVQAEDHPVINLRRRA